MGLLIIGLFLLFTCTGASLGSGHLDFMSGTNKEHLLHAKDPGAKVKDFSDSFRHIASSPDKVKTTFRILNQPNDSRFKLDLALIVSKIFILEDEAQSLENKKHAWSVLYPLLLKYDQNFTYPADYDIESGDYIEITVDDWIDRYAQKKVAVKSFNEDVDQHVGSGHFEVFESGDREMKSLMEGSGSFDEYLRSLEQQSDVLLTQEGSGSVEEHLVSEEDGVSVDLSDRATTADDSAEEAALQESEEAFVEEVELYRDSREEVSDEDEGFMENSEEMQAIPFVDGDDLMLQHRVGYAVEMHPEEVEKEPLQVGSIRSVPGVHFPDYEEIPITSFSCADKKYVPGFYADLETGCQVFHVCWPHRRESFLCPIGTLFNQAILACDYWYSTNCSLSHYYDDVTDRIHQSTTPIPPTHKPSPTKPCPHLEQSSRATPSYHPKQPTYSTPSYKTEQPSHSTPSYHSEPPATPSPSLADVDWTRVISILPIKSKVYVYPPHQEMKSSKTVPIKHHHPHQVKLSKTVSIKHHHPHQVTTLSKTVPIKHHHPHQVKLSKTVSIKHHHPHQVTTLSKTVPIKHHHPHQVTKLSKTVPIKHHLTKSAEDQVLKEAITSQIVSKVLHAAELMAKSARPLVSQIPSAQTPKKQKGIAKINPKFVVRSSDKLDDMKAILAAKGVARKMKTKVAKEQIPDILLGAMEMAGTVLQKDILPFTRMALVEGSLKHSKSKSH